MKAGTKKPAAKSFAKSAAKSAAKSTAFKKHVLMGLLYTN